MSSWATCRIECALCHQANTCSFLKSTNTFGGVSDLDTRHGGAARKDLLGTIQRCSHCGYCAPDIRRTHEKAAEIVPTDRYKQVVEDRSLPKLARAWLGWSLIAEEGGEGVEAGWAALSAAWACDDAGRSEDGERCRIRAATLFQAVIQAGQKFSPEAAGDAAILADILRRCGRFAEAKEFCAIEVGPETPEQIAAGLAFQRLLCEREDRRGYCFHDLERYRRDPASWRPIRWWEIVWRV
jgi:hypothetical protein